MVFQRLNLIILRVKKTNFAELEDKDNNSDNTENSFSFSNEVNLSKNHKLKTAFNYNANLSKLMNDDKEYIGKDSFKNPYINLSDQGQSMLTSIMGKRYKLTSVYFENDLSDDINYRFNEDNKVSGVYTEFAAKITKNLTASVSTGYLDEENSFLGSETGGAFLIDDNTKTTYYGIGADYNFDSYKFSANYNIGFTDIDESVSSSSYLSNFTNIVSDSFSIALEKDKILFEKDNLGIAFSQPLRVYKSSANANIPVALEANGNIIYENRRLDLSAEGRELNLEFFYKHQLDLMRDFKIGTLIRFEPENNSEANNEALFMVRYNQNF